MGYIYKITNLVNGKSYIGQTIQKIESRWRGHLSDLKSGKGSPKLQYAFDKYGEENFAFQTLEECPVEELDNREKYWINEYDTYENGYNSTLGGQTGGNKHDYRIIGDRYLELRSIRKTALSVGCSVSTVQNALKALKIDASALGKDTGRVASTKDFQLYYQEYLKNPKTTEVAKKFGTSPARVSKAITQISGKTPRELDHERRKKDASGRNST